VTGNAQLQKNKLAAAVTGAIIAGSANLATAQTAPDSSDGRAQIQEVIVTANRISQPASKTPLSLSVISGDDLKALGAVNASSLEDLVPNVQITAAGNTTIIAIRGISSPDTTEKGDPSASFNLDGVNLARPQSAGLAFYDLERVEVLRGPQGTLYGRNSTAGAVNLITNKPVGRFESSAAIEFGNFNALKFDGMVNIPINDVLAIRSAVSSSKHDGYLRSTQGFSHDYDDGNTVSGRIQALFKFNPDLKLLLSADTSTTKGAGPGQLAYSAFAAGLTGNALRTNTPSVEGHVDDKARGLSAELTVNTGIGALTYIGAHRTLSLNDFSWAGVESVYANATYHSINSYDQTSHELRLASHSGPVKTIAGLYWFKEEGKIHFDVSNVTPGPGVLNFTQNPMKSASKAAFGEATYSVTPQLNLTAGLRRTNDAKSRQGSNNIGSPVIFSAPNDASVSYGATTGKLGADYAPAQNVMLYASLSKGYKSGGFNDGTAASNSSLYYKPEYLTAAEVGFKGKFLEKQLQVSGDVFAYNYKDMQLFTVIVDPVTGAAVGGTRNAAEARVTGVEVEGKYLISGNDQISFSATYLDAKYNDYRPSLAANWKGYKLDKSPEATVGFGYSHDWDMENGARFTTTIGTHYTSSYVMSDFSNVFQLKQPAFHRSDATLQYSPASDKWTLQAYVRNIENKDVVTGYSNVLGRAISLAPPRTFGVRLSANF
jgi:iron complex outermembrane receptor protein